MLCSVCERSVLSRSRQHLVHLKRLCIFRYHFITEIYGPALEVLDFLGPELMSPGCKSALGDTSWLLELLGAIASSKALIIGGSETKKEACCEPAAAFRVSDRGAQGAAGSAPGILRVAQGCSWSLREQLRAVGGLTQVLAPGARSGSVTVTYIANTVIRQGSVF
jgi:hypothetical protein